MISAKSLSESKSEARFLQLQLVSETIALLPTEKVRENLELTPTQVLTIRVDRVVSMPHVASWVMGAYNYRGEILWLVDLGHLMGLTPIVKQARSLTDYTTVVVQMITNEYSNRLVGLVVNQVNSIERCELNAIKASSANPNTEYEQFFQGYWENSPTEVWAILDLDFIWQKIFD